MAWTRTDITFNQAYFRNTF
jgi:hypothetical protein